MNISDLPYLPRPDLENELRDFLQAHLSPRASTTKAILLNGEKGVGKRTLLRHCLENTPELQRYTVCPLDFRTPVLTDLTESNQKLKEKGLESLLEFAKESSPYWLKLVLSVSHIFTKDQILQARPQKNFSTLSDIVDFLFLLIEQRPVLLVIENFEIANAEQARSLEHLVNESHRRAIAFALVLIAHETSTSAEETLKNLRRFLRRDDHLRGLGIAPLTQQESVAQLTACGLSSAWAETLHRFSEGHPGPLNAMWQLLQAQDILQKESNQWVTRDEPRYILSQEFVRAQLRKLVQRHEQQIPVGQHELLIDGLLPAAAMGETFLPQAVAETALPREREYTAEEIAAWEDLWYEVLEKQSDNLPALAEPVQENGQNKTLTGAQGRSFFVYRFCDPQWQALLQHAAKQSCDPKQLDRPLHECLVHLEEWLHACFQENWEQALPYRIAVNRTLWQSEEARALEKLQRLQKLRVDLPQQINAERKRVTQGATAGGLYQFLRWYCEVLQERGEYPEALEAMYEAHTLVVQQKIQFTDLELAEHLNELGMCYYNCGEYEEAEPLFRLSLAIFEKQLGPEHPHVASSLNNLAGLLESQGKYSEVEPLHLRSLKIREKQLGPEHIAVAASLNNLAELLRGQGKYSEADPLYRRSVAILEKQLGSEHPDVASSLNNLAALLDSQGKYSEAEPLYRRSLAIREQQLGPEHPDVATSLNNLALLLDAQGKYSEAEPLYRRSLAIREQQLGPEHPDVATSLNSLAGLLYAQGKYSEADPLYRRSLAIDEKAYGADHPEVATSLNNLAALLDSQGKFSEAEPLHRRSLAIREQQLGPEHPDVATSLNNLAALLYAQGKYSEAESVSRRSLAILEKQLGPEHPNVATSLNNLARLLKSQGKYSEAEPLYRRAVEICEKSLGPDHPNTQTVRENYARLLAEMKS